MLGQWSALLAVLPSFQAASQPRWRAPYGVLFPSPNTRHVPCLSNKVSVPGCVTR